MLDPKIEDFGVLTPVTAMDLLDFPPEIFRHVIHCLVSDAGVVKSWKLRGVCCKSILFVVACMLGTDDS